MRVSAIAAPAARLLAALGLATILLAAPTATPALAAGQVPAQPVTPTPMAAHRALYRLSLDGTPTGDVVGAGGTMAYEVQDACDGWASRQRLEMTIVNHDGQDIQMLSDYATWESKDGLSFRFRMRQTTEGAVSTETEGSAKLTRTGGPGTVTYTRPTKSTEALPAGTLFPMHHTEALIAAAEAGKRFLAVPVFDGTVPSGAQDSFIVILDRKPAGPAPFPGLAHLASTRVNIAFFDRKPSALTPDYNVAMRYWANGVAADLRMDFGDFVMSGKLTELKLLPPPHC